MPTQRNQKAQYGRTYRHDQGASLSAISFGNWAAARTDGCSFLPPIRTHYRTRGLNNRIFRAGFVVKCSRPIYEDNTLVQESRCAIVTFTCLRIAKPISPLQDLEPVHPFYHRAAPCAWVGRTFSAWVFLQSWYSLLGKGQVFYY